MIRPNCTEKISSSENETNSESEIRTGNNESEIQTLTTNLKTREESKKMREVKRYLRLFTSVPIVTDPRLRSRCDYERHPESVRNFP